MALSFKTNLDAGRGSANKRKIAVVLRRKTVMAVEQLGLDSLPIRSCTRDGLLQVGKDDAALASLLMIASEIV
jgi:hypothetical protein